VTIPAQKLLSCVSRINRTGRSFGFGVISKVLQGKHDEYLEMRGLDKLSTFGVMSEDTTDFIRSVFDLLKKQEYISITDDKYQTVTVAEKASEVLSGGTKVYLKVKKEDQAATTSRSKERRRSQNSQKKYEVNPKLWEALRSTRSGIASENNVPAFVVFSDATLIDMCEKHPLTDEELLSVSGVGGVKLERYGERFLSVLKDFARTGNEKANN